MHLAFAIPEPGVTGHGGGADYMDGLGAALHDLGHRVDMHTGPSFVLAPGAVPVIDGMLLPRLRPQLDALIAADALAIIHHVSAAAGRNDGARAEVRDIEAEMLPRLRRVVATSQPVADRLQAEFGVAATVVEPGARDLPRAQPGDGEPLVLALGVLTRRKRHDHLLRAMARLVDLPWRLVIAGDAAREPTHAAELAALIDELGLANRVELRTDPSTQTLEDAWRTAAVFALATSWEGYPTAVAEALRRGVPVVVSQPGDPGRLVSSDAGAVVPAEDMATFGKCLRRLLFDDGLRRDMAEHAWRRGQQLPSWRERAQQVAALLEA